MRRLLILAEGAGRGLRDPLDQARPAFMLRNGVWTIARRWQTLLKPETVVAVVRPWLADLVTEQTGWRVNTPVTESFDDIWIIHGCATPVAWFDPGAIPVESQWSSGPDGVIRLRVNGWKSHGETLNAWIAAGAEENPPIEVGGSLPSANLRGAAGLWDLVNQVSEQLEFDARLWRTRQDAGRAPSRHPLTAVLAENAIQYGEGVTLAPHTVLDATDGPIIIDDRVTVEPFTRIDGPAYIGADTRLAGGKITGGCVIGPGCRIGGELENSIIQGFSNKVHEGFFGHGFLGEWVNLGALTTNSDLKNTYGTVRVNRNGETVDTGCLKAGSYLSDHVKLGIGTLLPTGATMGIGVNCASGGLTPGALPPFIWIAGGSAAEHDLERMLKTAAITIERRQNERRAQGLPGRMSEAEKSVLRHVFRISQDARRRYLQGSQHC